MTTEIQTEAAAAALDEFDKAFAEFSEQRDEPADAPAPTEAEASAGQSTGDEPVTTDVSTQEASPVKRSPEELALQLEEERKRAKDFEHRFKSEVGRQAALQRQIQELQARMNEPPKSAENRSRSEAMQKLMEDFPEIAGTLETVLEQRLGAIKQEVDKKLQPIVEKESAATADGEEAATLKVYPNLKELVNSDKFADWLPQQPAAVQALAASPRSSDAIALMDYFTGGNRPSAEESQGATDSTVQEIKRKREQQLGRHVSVKNTAPAPIADAPDDFESAFRHFAQKRERQASRY